MKLMNSATASRWGIRNTGKRETRNGVAWSADVYRNGVKVGTVDDEGNGGALTCRDLAGRYVGGGETERADRDWLAVLRSEIAACGITHHSAPAFALCLMADAADGVALCQHEHMIALVREACAS